MMAGWESSGQSWGWRGCSLDNEGCLSLQQILHSFSAPISEEHAWAVIHQALQCLSKLLDDLARSDTIAHVVSSTQHILINNEGKVHRNTFLSSKHSQRQKIVSENKTVAELGVVIFNALDFGLKEDEERQLSPALENMIDLMTSSDESDDLSGSYDTDDEGIEDDHDESQNHNEEDNKNQHRDPGGTVMKSGTCDSLIQLCRHHLALPTEADAHFRAVCRALVSEALELSSFMEKVSSNKSNVESDSELGQLDIQDWARLWVQVIHELRSGLKLKKTEYSKTPIEFELTPYEILMDDIRSRKYKLNKVMVEGGRLPPKVKRDAHDVILDFIRSRPPLKPAGERKLAAMRKQSTPVELLMESIRSEKTRHSLRKTSGPPTKPMAVSAVETSRCKLEDWQASPLPTKRMIRPDPDLVSSLLNFSDDDESGDDEPDISTNDDKNAIIRKNWHKQLALDQILHGPRLLHQRRHSVSVCQTPIRAPAQDGFSVPQKPTQKKISVDLDCEGDSPLSPLSSFDSPADQWVAALQTLELTLEEVVHIRSVLTRAELEALPLDNNLKEDVEKGKICFLCMKTRFGMFNWGTRCQMCSQQVCGRCSAKMRIPLDHFSSVPVFALTPQTPSPEPQDGPFAAFKDRFSSLTPDLSFFSSITSAGSAPSSPVNKRKQGVSSMTRPASAGPTSLPVFTSQGPSTIISKMGEMGRVLSRTESRADRKESIIGTLLTVCTDCKEMVLQVIRAQKTARRLQMTQSLFLNLTPVYTKEEIH
eukprot:TRINITY_DN11131_c0_g1_i2.p1 TRINITY_DN11131_c0_g1~~TRINITY_DN11131_c0_g1_i2.p1  ORF type:complete len:764 (-),score=139.71 TRINITY_DN11131_c0_g1_i2:1070-3361(-)